MVTSNSKGAELRFPKENGGVGVAAHIHLRTDSALNFVLELHVPDPVLLAGHKAEVVEGIEQFITDTRSVIYDALSLNDLE